MARSPRPFDTLQLARALRDRAGFTGEHAEAAAVAIADFLRSNLGLLGGRLDSFVQPETGIDGGLDQTGAKFISDDMGPNSRTTAAVNASEAKQSNFSAQRWGRSWIATPAAPARNDDPGVSTSQSLCIISPETKYDTMGDVLDAKMRAQLARRNIKTLKRWIVVAAYGAPILQIAASFLHH